MAPGEEKVGFWWNSDVTFSNVKSWRFPWVLWCFLGGGSKVCNLLLEKEYEKHYENMIKINIYPHIPALPFFIFVCNLILSNLHQMSVSFIEPSHQDRDNQNFTTSSTHGAEKICPEKRQRGWLFQSCWCLAKWFGSKNHDRCLLKMMATSLHVTARMYLLDIKIIVYLYHSPTGSHMVPSSSCG